MSRAPSSTNPPSSQPTLGLATGTLLVIANMIGVGVFTTTGFMVSAIPSPPAVLLAWFLGGVAALSGALTYAELGAALPRNGGEYRLLSRIYHPAIGFTAGWVSLIVGFSAPLALFAMAFGRYLEGVFPQIPAAPAGLCLIVVLALLNACHMETGNRFHNAFTLGKVGLILLFIVAGAFRGTPAQLGVASPIGLAEHVLSPSFAVQLVYVSFAYAGWNTAAYLAGEFRRPQRDIPLAVMIGVTVVTLLYMGLNLVFLSAAPLSELAGQEKVGHVAATHLFGESGGRIVSLMIVAGLVSTVSANLISGPRVYEAMGTDFPRLKFLTLRRAAGGPIAAIALQAGLAAAMLITSSFDGLLAYIGITLSLCAASTVLGAILLRSREPDLPRPYRTWGYPLTPLIYLALEGWMVVFTVKNKPQAALFSLLTIVVGLIAYRLVCEEKGVKEAQRHRGEEAQR
jgi:basic amino acid/polyamine antiporter, APA family